MNQDFETYIGALGTMFENVEQLVRDGQGSPPWQVVFDPDNAPNNTLTWLAQWVGVELERQSSFENDEQFYARQRERIKAHLGFDRGSAKAMRAAASLYLTGNKQVFFRERDGDAYTLTVITRIDETPDPDAVLRELMRLKPAGIVLNFLVTTGRTFEETTALGQTFATSTTTWPTFNDREGA
jgi:hypothetical protein